MFGKGNVVNPKAVKKPPSGGDWVGIADYRPGATTAKTLGSAYTDVSSRCRYGVWRPTTPLPSGLYYANCRVELTGSVLRAPVTVAAEGTIDVVLRRGARLTPFVDGVSLVTASRRWDAMVVGGDHADVDGALVARSGWIGLFGNDLDFGSTVLGARISIFGIGLDFG